MEWAMRAVGTLSLAVAAIPIALIVWKIVRTPVRTWIPLLIGVGLFALVQGCVRLVDPEAVWAIMFLIAGGGKSM